MYRLTMELAGLTYSWLAGVSRSEPVPGLLSVINFKHE